VEKELYPKYHEWMGYRLKASGSDETGGREYRRHLERIAQRVIEDKNYTYDDFMNEVKITDDKIVKITKEQVLETSLQTFLDKL
jgi:hypothetical protein